MSSIKQKEGDDKKSYLFFSDPDAIVKKAESNIESLKSLKLLQPKDDELKVKQPGSDQVEPYPFTFISAVKRKLALVAENDCKKLTKPTNDKLLSKLHEENLKMDFIKPLKIPDSKIISPKTIEYSSPRETLKNLPSKLSSNKEKIDDCKMSSSVSRKLDFSATSSASGNNENKLKLSDVISYQSLMKKKDRDSSREKENRSKRMKKDDDELSRIKRHLPRKDDKSKSERLYGANELKKLKKSSKKSTEDERKSRSHCSKSSSSSSLSRIKAFDDKKLNDYITIRDNFRESDAHKYNEDYQMFDEDNNPESKRDKSKTRHNRMYKSEEDKEDKSDYVKGDKSFESQEVSKIETDESFLDPRKISLRDDSYSNQEEFCNLITPDLNLIYKPKKKKDYRNFEDNKQDEDENPKVHPTALHMQFQAELHLFDSFNESIRQVTDVENALYHAKEQEKASKLCALTDGLVKDESDEGKKRFRVEVQTQTANDIATQTDIISESLLKYCENADEIDLDKLEAISMSSKFRTMSEISLHETTSSIKTETGTEISISTRDVNYSFNKYYDLEMAQLMKGQEEMDDNIEMFIQLGEKKLHDRTKKLLELETQRKLSRENGKIQGSSSMKKKQRGLLLKLQQDKAEMNRLKELHKLTSQERKLMLQKQRNMFNPQNIRTILKKSADCQSPRRLSGPMKGYDYRSNSSVSSHIDSDKSQFDRSMNDKKSDLDDFTSGINKFNQAFIKCKHPKLEDCSDEFPKKYELRTRKFEDKMPKSEVLKGLKAHQMEIESKLLQTNGNNSLKSESDTLVEELSRKSKLSRDRNELDELMKKKPMDKMNTKKLSSFNNQELKTKRKSLKSGVKSKSNGALLDNILKCKQPTTEESDDGIKYKKSKIDKDWNDSQNSLDTLVKHSRALKEKNSKLLRDDFNDDFEYDVDNPENVSTRSQISTFTISKHSSGDSEKSYTKSVVIRSQDPNFKASKKLEQILRAKEATLEARKNCVEDWIAWHARLKAEESRVARMEETAFKLINATSTALSCHDTTVSSDTSDIENRVEMLAEKLAERRSEMAKLKKEAHKQAKQRLKALEANLLNQIKKYDMTIGEMKKKLESKKNLLKDDGKLAIEAKYIADFKVPELPIKRIQEIYKSNDLLRSRSESDLILSEMKKSNCGSDYHSVNSLLNKEGKADDSREKINRSIESVLEEAKSLTKTVKSTVSGSTSSIKTSLTGDKSNSSEVKTDLSSKNSNELVDKNILNKTSDSKTLIDEELSENNDSKLFSKKLDLLYINNKNLSDDINTLENDLKSLSELMSRYSKKSDKLNDETSKDITEELPKSLKSSIVDDSNIKTISDDKSVNISINDISKNIDYEARSKEILSVIEKSIISEHIKSAGSNLELTGAALEESMKNLHKENEALSSDFNSLEGDIKSISEIISKISKQNESDDKNDDDVDDDEEEFDISTEESVFNSINLPINSSTDNSILSSDKNKSTSQIFDQLNSDNKIETEIENNKIYSEDKINNSIISNVDETLNQSQDNNLNNIENNMTIDITNNTVDVNKDESEISVFIPESESTNFNYKYTDTFIDESSIKPDTDELDDILDIIKRDTLNSQLESTNLTSEFHLNKTNVNNLNLTADIEPVLQKLTETLQNVEKNIAKRTQSKTDDTDNHLVSENFSEVIKDPEYEDISEESLEVSEILESKNLSKIPDKYNAIEKPDDVLRILDELSQQSVKSSKSEDDGHQKLEEKNEKQEEEQQKSRDDDPIEYVVEEPKDVDDHSKKLETELSESSEEADTPRGVSEIDLDSPRDQNDSRLDIEILDDDMLNNKMDKIGDENVSSERKIEMMIEKLKASLDQPEMDVSELNAKLLQIERLQIELQIEQLKKEEEEVSYYVREIPNKPPPPYTPPGGANLSSPDASQILSTSVVPNNIEELSSFTDKATVYIFNAKQLGKNIISLEIPTEIYELGKETTDLAKKHQKIYNTFLFDLCKEIIFDVYQSEYKQPGPVWTKPNVKTKPIIKIPKTVNENNEYVSKEVATLFGFKTKLQRENMVMRWSRKRRDRVDELLAREAQAEEDEWTKFHHDELTVKNELTLTILNTLIFDTTNALKSVFAKKRLNEVSYNF